MADAKFNLKEPNKSGKTLINIIFRFNGLKFKGSTTETILPKHWNPEKQRARVTKDHPEYSELNTRLDKQASGIKAAYLRLCNENIIPTVELIKMEFDNIINPKRIPFQKEEENSIPPIDLYTFVEQYKEKVKNTLKLNTIKVYNTTIKHLREYEMESEYRIDFSTITLDFYYDFVDFLLSKGLYNNAVGKYVKTIKSILRKAEKSHITVNQDYKSDDFKVFTEEPDTIYLNEQELKQFYEYKFGESELLELTRDLFIIGACTGLRFSDFTRLQKEHFFAVNESKIIQIRTLKTEEEVSVPVHWMVEEIMQKYNYSLSRIISNDKMNSNLKKIGEKIGLLETTLKVRNKGSQVITETYMKYQQLTTHTCRRSFCTNGFLNGIHPKILMKISGHKTERSFMRYIRISNLDNALMIAEHPFFKKAS